jgi:hypothetical protein
VLLDACGEYEVDYFGRPVLGWRVGWGWLHLTRRDSRNKHAGALVALAGALVTEIKLLFSRRQNSSKCSLFPFVPFPSSLFEFAV